MQPNIQSQPEALPNPRAQIQMLPLQGIYAMKTLPDHGDFITQPASSIDCQV